MAPYSAAHRDTQNTKQSSRDKKILCFDLSSSTPALAVSSLHVSDSALSLLIYNKMDTEYIQGL